LSGEEAGVEEISLDSMDGVGVVGGEIKVDG
jgi:hypothetical protein